MARAAGTLILSRKNREVFGPSVAGVLDVDKSNFVTERERHTRLATLSRPRAPDNNTGCTCAALKTTPSIAHASTRARYTTSPTTPSRTTTS